MCECGSNRELKINAKCNDMCAITHVPAIENGEANPKFGYVPRNLGIGGGDYIRLSICLDCQRVINFPELDDEEIDDALRTM